MRDTIDMAREAGFNFDGVLYTVRGNHAQLAHLEALVRADEREAMVAEAAKQGWAMKNEGPFEDCVREIAAIRARSNT